MECVVILHDTIHGLHTKKMGMVIFKIDFEEAYDKVWWFVLEHDMWMQFFFPDSEGLVNNFPKKGNTAIKLKEPTRMCHLALWFTT